MQLKEGSFRFDRCRRLLDAQLKASTREGIGEKRKEKDPITLLKNVE